MSAAQGSRTFRRAATTLAAGTALSLAFGGVALADNIQDDIVDTSSGVTLEAGSETGGTAKIRVVGNNSDGATTDPQCNWDFGESALVLNVVTPAGVTASPDPLSITACLVDHTVTFTADATAVSGTVTVSITSSPAGGGGYNNQVNIPITITQPPNTKPSVVVTGVTNGATYEIGSVPTAGCAVTDAEDDDPTASPTITGTLSHGLGSQTVTCDYTDEGGLAADTATATYTIVDTGDPTISHTLTPAANANGWSNQDVVVDFTCDDGTGSGIQSCTGDTTLGEGANQSATGTATDWAGNTATDTASGINVDKTKPTLPTFSSFPSQSYATLVPAAPTCSSSDALSGLASCGVTGYSTAVGTHTLTATATDNAGNTETATLVYTVSAWTLQGFYAPVDMGNVWNTVKGGSTVPLKFEVFAGSELTTTSAVKTFTQKQVTCPNASATIDEIEIVSTGGTSLRYDAAGGQFIQNWATPKKPGTCHVVTMTTQDGSTISANFVLK